MKKLRLHITTILLIFLTTLTAKSVELQMVRSDVDSNRKSMITAGYSFGYDVYVEGLERVSSVVFNLRYNNAQYIQYSGYNLGDLQGKAKALVLESVDPSNPNGKIISVAVFIDSASAVQLTKPKMINLEFVVWQFAPDGIQAYFTASNIVVSAFNDEGVGRQYGFPSINLPLTIHGYLNMWPGDANGNGVVDSADIVVFQDYFKNKNSLLRNSRTFKRRGATTRWVGQQVLRWDVAPATFVDSDGDGAITITDGLIIFQNDGRRRSEAPKSEKNPNISSSEKFDLERPKSINSLEQSNQSVCPIYFDNELLVRAFTLRIKLPNNAKISGIATEESISSNSYLIYSQNENELEILIGSFSNPLSINSSQPLVYLIFDTDKSNLVCQVTQAEAIDINNVKHTLSQFSSVGEYEERTNFTAYHFGNQLTIDTQDASIAEADVFIFDVLGNKTDIKDINFSFNNISINTNSLQRGVYFLQVLADNRMYRSKFIVE